MADRVAWISINTAQPEPGGVVHGRAWPVSGAAAESIAKALTGLFGAPIEAAADVGKVADFADQSVIEIPSIPEGT